MGLGSSACGFGGNRPAGDHGRGFAPLGPHGSQSVRKVHVFTKKFVNLTKLFVMMVVAP